MGFVFFIFNIKQSDITVINSDILKHIFSFLYPGKYFVKERTVIKSLNVYNFKPHGMASSELDFPENCVVSVGSVVLRNQRMNL